MPVSVTLNLVAAVPPKLATRSDLRTELQTLAPEARFAAPVGRQLAPASAQGRAAQPESLPDSTMDKQLGLRRTASSRRQRRPPCTRDIELSCRKRPRQIEGSIRNRGKRIDDVAFGSPCERKEVPLWRPGVESCQIIAGTSGDVKWPATDHLWSTEEFVKLADQMPVSTE